MNHILHDHWYEAKPLNLIIHGRGEESLPCQDVGAVSQDGRTHQVPHIVCVQQEEELEGVGDQPRCCQSELSRSSKECWSSPDCSSGNGRTVPSHVSGGARAQQARHHVSQQEQEEQEEDPPGDQQGGGHGPDRHGHEVNALDEYIKEASSKIEELLEAIRKKGTGAQLEVKESILHGSAELVKAIKRLVNKSKALQKEIISERGDAGVSDKESNELRCRWTRGIICAAKSVRHGVQLLVDAVER